MKKTKILYFLIGLLVGAFLLQPSKKVEQNPGTKVVPTIAVATPTVVTPTVVVPVYDEFKKMYMEGCTTGEAYCSCTYDYLESHYGVEYMVELGNKITDSNSLPPEVFDAATECYQYLK